VGELAKRMGLSVRALHYYEEISLLWPSRRAEADYCLYSAGDVVRLKQIKLLRQLGLREQIKLQQRFVII
jgi:DNA-binding transcriptional MerR regulator